MSKFGNAIVVLGLLPALGCARSEDAGRHGSTPARDVVVLDAGGMPDADGVDSTGSGTGSGPRSDPDVGDEDCELGEQREATKEESGSYCVCVDDVGTRWRCFGPDPEDAPPAGGARGAPRAVCRDVYGQAGKESCLVQWSCGDDHLYAIACIEGACVCLVDNTSTAELEPMTSCPDDVASINELCGWELENP